MSHTFIKSNNDISINTYLYVCTLCDFFGGVVLRIPVKKMKKKQQKKNKKLQKNTFAKGVFFPTLVAKIKQTQKKKM